MFLTALRTAESEVAPESLVRQDVQDLIRHLFALPGSPSNSQKEFRREYPQGLMKPVLSSVGENAK